MFSTGSVSQRLHGFCALRLRRVALLLSLSFVMLAALMLAAANGVHACDGPGARGRILAVDALESNEDRTSISSQSEVQIVFSLD